MTERVVAGYVPDERGDDALALAGLVVAADRSPLTVANVYPPSWPTPGPGRVDAEWLRFVKEQSREALDLAAGRLAGRVPKSRLRYVTHPNRGSGRGLIEVAEESDAGLIVIGSAPRGRPGRIAIGSTADQLLHGAPVPVLMAPRGYAEDPPERFDRLTVAYWPRRGAELGLAAAVEVARRLEIPVRLLTLLVRPAGLGVRLRGGEDFMHLQHEYAVRDLNLAAQRVTGLGQVVTEAAEGAGVDKALRHCDWLPGEILVCMSSAEGPLRKVFLGSVSGKIVRAAPCPVVVLPSATLK
ncbi:universal stress protein [Thermomonospora umbrina]|uniref:Nucleotide-binding universal stress UspA family protein n=1 Tax=Thermomonospora umbrina TaxID=111806 RepID=A0A3D9SYU5_9ACTN|nr:universal stress protein [Thermomonospora umbrina]REF01120.1 nucleotide-binding universal stress UspA family protein [Thermomonospora umbrina]